LSIVSIGMGFANMDFLVRESRECIDGDMYMIRFGSCGCLTDLPIGSIVVPQASVAVTRNFDFDFASTPSVEASLGAYRISKPCSSDPRLHDVLVRALNDSLPKGSSAKVAGVCLNASADSFYSSQGRTTSFEDHNSFLLEYLLSTVPALTTLEMETFQLLHLAQSYNRQRVYGMDRGSIFAAAAHMVFASRITTDNFITPEEVVKTQEWAGRGCLDALAAI